MISLIIIEFAFFPLYLLSFRILQKYGLLTENRFGLMLVAYLSLVASTIPGLFPEMSVGKIIGAALVFLCWFPGYLIAKSTYRRIFLSEM